MVFTHRLKKLIVVVTKDGHLVLNGDYLIQMEVKAKQA